MLSAGAEELAITADGTSNAPVEALLTASDLALFCAWNPMRLVAAIRHARSIGELAALRRQADRMVLDALAQPRDVDDCRLMASEAGTALAGACIRLARTEVLAAGLEPPGASHCWVNFGASVRGDLLATTLPVIAAVYDDSSDRCAPQDSMYFAALVGQTMAAFHACGLSGADIAWPGGSRPSMPLSEWKRLYCETIRNPLGHDLYARREFFDFGPLSGDRAVFARLREYVAQELAGHEAVIPLLANDTFANLPPLTFFRGLVLEMDGEQRESFDIAQAAVTPIVAAARVFALAKGRLASSGTLERLKTAALDFPQGAEVFQEAAEAFRIAVYYQSLAGGPRIHPRNLRKFDQLLLKNAFSSVQRLLEFTAATLIPSG
jgi:CBS domain-containing protein